MIDYAESLLALAKGTKELDHLLLSNEDKKAVDKVDDLIVTLIDLKLWLKRKNENNK